MNLAMASFSPGMRCEYVDKTTASVTPTHLAAENSRPSGLGNDFKEPAQLGSFLFFMFGGLLILKAARNQSCVSKDIFEDLRG